MHVFTFSVRHYKPRTCYKRSGSRCGTNRQGHHAEPTNKIQIIVVVLGSTLKGIVAVKPNVCMECAGVTLMHGCSTTEAFLDLVAMVRVGPSEAMCSIQHEIDFAWKHTALRIE